MKSPKAVKRAKKPVKCLRNQNARRGKRLERQRSALKNWMNTSVSELPKPKSASLCPIFERKVATQKNKEKVATKEKKPEKHQQQQIKQQKKVEQKSDVKQQEKVGRKAETSPSTIPSEVPKVPDINNNSAPETLGKITNATTSPPSSGNSTDSGIDVTGSKQSANIPEKSTVKDENQASENQSQKVPEQNGKIAELLRVMDEQRRSRSPRSPRGTKLLPKDIEFCVYMMQKYGEDFEKMSLDEKNVFHDPPEMIARKLRIFRDSPYFVEYQGGGTLQEQKAA